MATRSTRTCTECVVRLRDGIVRTDLEPDDRAYEACDDGNYDSTDSCLESAVSALRQRLCSRRCGGIDPGVEAGVLQRGRGAWRRSPEHGRCG